MRRAIILALGTALCTVGLSASAADAPATAAKAASWKPMRNAMGQPDLSGYWSNATLTPLVRNPRISDKAALSAEEAKGFEQIWAKALADSDAPTAPDAPSEVGQASNLNSKLVEIRPDLRLTSGWKYSSNSSFASA